MSKDNFPSLSSLRARGWTLKQAGDEVGCTESHLSRVCAGKRECSPALADALAALPHRDFNPGRGKDRNPLPRNLRRRATVS